MNQLIDINDIIHPHSINSKCPTLSTQNILKTGMLQELIKISNTYTQTPTKPKQKKNQTIPQDSQAKNMIVILFIHQSKVIKKKKNTQQMKNQIKVTLAKNLTGNLVSNSTSST